MLQSCRTLNSPAKYFDSELFPFDFLASQFSTDKPRYLRWQTKQQPQWPRALGLAFVLLVIREFPKVYESTPWQL